MKTIFAHSVYLKKNLKFYFIFILLTKILTWRNSVFFDGNKNFDREKKKQISHGASIHPSIKYLLLIPQGALSISLYIP